MRSNTPPPSGKDNSLQNIFGTPAVEPLTTLMALNADTASLMAGQNEMHKRLDKIERAITDVGDLAKSIVAVQAETSNNSRRVDVLATRVESIDKQGDIISQHDLRLQTLERDLITNGELRMSTLEKGRAKAVTVLSTFVVTVLLPGLGWVIATYVAPLIHFTK